MTRFCYRAARADGSVVSGILTSPGEAEGDAFLLNQGLQPLALEPVVGTSTWWNTPSRRELAILFRSLATLVDAGVPLDRALAASEHLARHAQLRHSLHEAGHLLAEGLGLAEALGRAECSVPDVVLGMLRSGERGSRIGPALERAASQLEMEADLTARIRQATAYPLILLVAGAVSLGVITTVVVPRFAVILADLGQSLPPATRLLLEAARVVRTSWPLLLLTFVTCIAVFVSWRATPRGRLHLHRALLRLPVVGMVRHGFATARVARALGALLATGVPILTALDAAREGAGDAEVRERLLRAGQRVREGEGLSASLAAETALTPSALQVLAIGDSSGRLGNMALRAGDLAAAEAEVGLRMAVSFLEPALVVLFGGLVAFTAAALLQAVYSLRPGG